MHATWGGMGVQVSQGFGLVWPGKQSRSGEIPAPEGQLVAYPAESYCPECADGNRILEGDNLPILRALQSELSGAVGLIYIDPPYNTGNDFIYNDTFRNPRQRQTAEEPGRRHTRWLEMMHPRIELARTLLRADALFCVSIDDHEVHHLRLLLDEVFGEENFVAQLIWKRHSGGGNDARHFAVDHEYILVYARDRGSLPPLRLPLDAAQRSAYIHRDEHFDSWGPYKTKSFLRMRPDDPRPGLQYGIELPNGDTRLAEWKWEESRFHEGVREGRIVFRQDRKERWLVEYKLYLRDDNSERTQVPRTLLLDVERNAAGKSQLKALFDGAIPFPNPKPVGLIRLLLQLHPDRDRLVLDFFAGSGTTGQAVLEENASDGGSRRFVLVQEAQPTGCPNIPSLSALTRERVRRWMIRTQTESGFLAARWECGGHNHAPTDAEGELG